MSVLAGDTRLGVLLGQAVGDALGAGTEFQSAAEIGRRHGQVQAEYVQGVNPGFKPGEFTDDTQMALCILGGYWDARLHGADLLDATLKRFQAWADARPPDIGIATRGSLSASRQDGLMGGFREWAGSGYQSAGNGALMRASASVVAGSRGDALRREAVLLAMLTHPDPRSLLACWAFVAVLEACLDGAVPADAWRSALDELDDAAPDAWIVDVAGAERAQRVLEHLPSGRAAVREAVERGLTGRWRSQSGFVIDTLEAVVAGSLAPTFLDGILPIVARGEDSDTVAAIAGAVLGARGLLPPSHLLGGLRCYSSWPTWPAGESLARPVLAAFVPPFSDVPATSPDDPDDEELTAYRLLRTLPPFECDDVGMNVTAGRAPLFRRDVWRMRAGGVTHVLDLREDHEWNERGRRGASAVEEIRRLGMVRFAVTVLDMGAPSLADLDAAVSFIEAARHLGGTVYVHCRAGQERTAGVLAAWYARARQCSVAEALERLREHRPIFHPNPGQVAAAHAWLLRERERGR